MNPSWSDSITGDHDVTAGTQSIVLMANYITRYMLTTSAASGGSIAPASGWRDAGSSVTLTATPQGSYSFSGFSGDITSASNPLTFTMDSPKSVVANFSSVPVSISLSPSSITLGPGQQTQFNATVTNSTNTSVTWSLSPALGGNNPPPLGSISSSGQYTAPGIITYGTSVRVTATSVADPTKSAYAFIQLTVPNPPYISMGSIPTSGTYGAQTYTFIGQANPGQIRTIEARIGVGQSVPAWYQTNCSFSYDRSNNTISVFGIDWMGNPSTTSATLGAPTTLSGYSCQVSVGSSSASVSGTALTLNVSITLPSGYNDFIATATDYSGYSSGWVYFGRENIYAW